MKHAKAKKRLSEGLRIVLAALLMVSGIALVIILRSQYVGPRYDRNAVSGSIGNGMDSLVGMKELMDKGMITISINATPMYRLSEKGKGINWNIENPASQSTKLIRVEIYRDDTGEKIYETGVIPPGNYVTGTQPDVDLETGEYICTAYFYSYDIETEEYLGQAGAQITLYVLE